MEDALEIEGMHLVQLSVQVRLHVCVVAVTMTTKVPPGLILTRLKYPIFIGNYQATLGCPVHIAKSIANVQEGNRD